jgi:Family of unknown function (DUF6459)
MQQNLPPELPRHIRRSPAPPAEVPLLPTTLRPPGRTAPLPDPVAIRRLPVPDSAPPYDDERGPAAAGAQSPRPPVPSGPAGPGRGPGGQRPARPQPGGPGPGTWPSQFAQVLAETLAGSRPATQLTPWTTDQTRKRIRTLGATLASGERPRVRRVMTSAPSPDVLEVTAVVGFGPRVRVLAVRLERADQACPHWRCTAIESA